MKRLAAFLAAFVAASWSLAAGAEVSEIRIARQFGITFLPLMVMEKQKLVEKHAKAAGVTVTEKHLILGTPAAINDGVLSGTAHLVAVGVPSFATVWARTRGTPSEMIGVANVTYLNMLMNTRRPNIKSVRDITEKDRIIVTSPKVSLPAILLQMEAAKIYGWDKYTHFDALSVGMAHPDGTTALITGSSPEICCHFTSPPFQGYQLRQPGIHTILSVEQVMGGPTSGTIVFGKASFRNENPKVFAAFLAALAEAVDFINKDKRAAAELYLSMAKDMATVDDIVAQLNDPSIRYDLTPLNTMKYFDFMHRVGTIKVKPNSWKDVFVPEVHNRPGS